MGDWIGLAFFVLLIVGVLVGLRFLSKPRSSTAEEFDKRADESASLLGAGISAINGMLNPQAAKGKTAIEEVKKGTSGKRESEGKAIGKDKWERND